MSFETIRYAVEDHVATITLNRPHRLNAFTLEMGDEIIAAFDAADADDEVRAVIVTGEPPAFCAGADLKAVAAGRGNKSVPEGDYGPMGPSRLELSKPVIAAVDGYAVAGGLELACWCDLRVASPNAKFGVFCRRFGVPLIDGGTIRLPRLIGASRAMDMILTGREVGAEEALSFGLVNYVSGEDTALPMAIEVARRIAGFPQLCMRTDRASALAQWSLPMEEALRREIAGGLTVIERGETRDGAKRFTAGVGRGGLF